ncbi:glutathione S-transferase A-like [Neolamprologus brichardi]|uniref:glutathione S-transferase A-like n=1 Tax=Neolamprologus brichardi TaxID=32507 RepID=UPI001643D697|nr:glutathione S-transferase A-like [Neolamprologus brichardi]
MAKDMTLLWGSGSPPCWRIMIALEEKNLQGYNQKLLSFEKGEHKSKEVMDINPRGQLPAFKCGDVPVNESCAACFHLECKYKSQGTKLIPDCEAGLAQILQRVFEVNALVEKSSSVIYYNRLSEQRYPKLAEYYKGLMNRPSIKASWPPTWKNAPKQEALKDI